MKILFCIRNDYLKNFAGDSKQLLETVDYLRKKGLSVTINSGEIDNYEYFDIIHLFNLTRITETYRFFKTAQKFDKPVVITPIYWDLRKYYRFINDMQGLALWDYYRTFRMEIIKGCRMIYPASLSEMNSLREDYGDEFPYTVIYSGVSKLETNSEAPEELLSLKPYLFCAARICPRKNQLELCRAASELGLPLILAGNINSREYFNQCLSFPNVHYRGILNENELWPLYENAALHVLGSFLETPGLSNLEAGLCGADIVSTGEGSAVEYFENLSGYCNPYVEDNVKESILSALEDSKQPALKQHIESRFLWGKCLSPLPKSYKNLIGRTSGETS